MDWIKLIIVAIGIVIWIASNLKEKPKPLVRPVPPPLPPPEPEGGVRRQEDLRTFLDDVRRQLEGAPPAAPPPLPVETARSTMPTLDPRRPKKRRKPNAPPDRPKVGTEPAPAVVALPMPRMPAMESPDGPEVPRSHTYARDAVRLLRSRSTMATAIVLAEVLGPPLAKRRPLRAGSGRQSSRNTD